MSYQRKNPSEWAEDVKRQFLGGNDWGGDEFQDIGPDANRARLAALDAQKERDKHRRKGRGLESFGTIAERVLRGAADE